MTAARRRRSSELCPGCAVNTVARPSAYFRSVPTTKIIIIMPPQILVNAFV